MFFKSITVEGMNKRTGVGCWGGKCLLDATLARLVGLTGLRVERCKINADRKVSSAFLVDYNE